MSSYFASNAYKQKPRKAYKDWNKQIFKDKKNGRKRKCVSESKKDYIPFYRVRKDSLAKKISIGILTIFGVFMLFCVVIIMLTNMGNSF